MEGGIAFIYDWRKRNATLSNNDILIQAANGLCVEGKLLGKHGEAEEISQLLLEMKNEEESEILKRCIYLYTLESFLYKLVNNVLRENDKNKTDTVAPFCYLLTEAIWSDHLAHERFKGTVYRGALLSLDSIKNLQEAIGTYRCWYGFTSTSKIRQLSEQFGNVLFIIDISVVGGLDISLYSMYHDENEVILSPGSTIRIDKVEAKNDKMIVHVFIVPEYRMVLLGRTGIGNSAFDIIFH